MDETKNLILAKGINKTKEIKECKFDPQQRRYIVTFVNSNCVYQYASDKIMWLVDPIQLDPDIYRIETNHKALYNICKIFVFKGEEEYWHIVFNNGSGRTYPRGELKVQKSCHKEPEIKDRLEYLRQLSEINNLKTEDGKALLKEFYEKLTFVGEDSALSVYLYPEKNPIQKMNCDFLIFPFGGNESQFKAVENAIANQLSVIQGPPGTGKTQTILNIIANLLLRGKTVQVVSSNNNATKNVYEKLEKYGLNFVVAPLGKKDNKSQFINAQTGKIPNLSAYQKNVAEQQQLKENITALSQELATYFGQQTRLACAKQELSSLELEMRYFQRYIDDTMPNKLYKGVQKPITSKEVMRIIQECDSYAERKNHIPLWHRLKNTLFRGVFNWGFYKNDISVIITYLQKLFYNTRLCELENEIENLKGYLSGVKAEGKMKRLTEMSLAYFRAVLYDRYGGKTDRVVFTEDSLWKNPQDVVREYPVVLSATFSSRNTLKNITYDYVIMDEASQVDIATGALALSCARNAVIVGDLKQLSNIIKGEDRKQSDAIFADYGLPAGYNFSEYSFLKSVCSVNPAVPQALLREHYRCHPKIIGFCNQKFYNNELIIMTEDYNEQDTMVVIRTSAGNHQRGHTNQRQIDVIMEEVLPKLYDRSSESIGIIAPYCDQVEAVVEIKGDKGIEVDTVHKFQGREKDAIIITVVDDVVSDFADKPDMVNVVVSRAKKRLIVVVSGNEQPKDSNLQDLIDYIEYNNFEVVNSKLYSIFDLLYQQYTKERQEFLSRHKRISQYDSENLMYGALVDMLAEFPELPLSIICHQKLRMLLRDFNKLDAEECRYALNENTHVDFLIYNRITKKPVLAIEVDGFNFHKKGTDQAKRDELKNRILYKYAIPLFRFPTNGSGEIEKIRNALKIMYKS